MFASAPDESAAVPGRAKTARTRIMHLLDLIEVVGSLLILAAFAGLQTHRVGPASLGYLILNLAGSAVLAGIALVQRSWGFLLLEGTWAIVSLISLLAIMVRPRRGDPAAHGKAAGPHAVTAAPRDHVSVTDGTSEDRHGR
jgi:hypothetical protein